MYRPSDTPNCASTDNELFFVQDGESTYKQIKMLKKICGSCVVQKECLEYALNYNVLGYWGNTTEHQRKAIRQARNIIPTPLYLTYN